MRKFEQIHELLVQGQTLPIKNRDHRLSGNWEGCRECHIEPDWLLIYRVFQQQGIIEYVRMGTHADLFD